MKIISKRMVETEIIEDYICNKCGEPCNNLGLLNEVVRGGYESPHLGAFEDQDYYEFSLCEKCLKEIFVTFKHPAFQYNSLDYCIDEDEKK